MSRILSLMSRQGKGNQRRRVTKIGTKTKGMEKKGKREKNILSPKLPEVKIQVFSTLLL